MVTAAGESLGDYVRRFRGERSLSEIEANSGRKGAKVSASYINRIENGLVKRPSSDRLIAIANGLGVPVGELLAVASGEPLDEMNAEELRLLIMFRALPADKRDDLLIIARAFERKVEEREVNSGELSHPEESSAAPSEGPSDEKDRASKKPPRRRAA
jgi:transcriptional regulator with XRE-family HTH domain